MTGSSHLQRSLWRCTRISPSCSYLLLPFLVPPPCVEFGLLGSWEFGLLGSCGFGGCLIFDGPISPKELKLSCGLVLPAAAETQPTCFTIWCRFFIWSLTQDILRFYGDQVELKLLMILVTSETSPFWNYNHAHQRTQEVSNPTLLDKDRVGSCQKPKKNSKLPFHPNIAKSRNRRHCKYKETKSYVGRFPLGCCDHITLCVTTVASSTEEEGSNM